MVFSSITFLLYFLPIVFLVYYILAFSRPLQNIWLVIASLLFYAWGEPIYVFLMLASITCNWLFGMMLLWIRKDKVKARRLVLIIACVLNLGMLGIFKYSGFVVETVNGIMERPFLPYPNIVLPIGISFFTFQALSYVIDVYMGNAEPQKNLLDIALYVAFFPQLIAGPIVKYSAIAEQIKTRRTDLTMLTEGICRFCEGFCKKILIANNLAVIADTVFNLTKGGDSTIPVPMLLAWLGAVSYMFQLYYDFSAYSDMAIGLGLMFGFRFSENFRYPFEPLHPRVHDALAYQSCILVQPVCLQTARRCEQQEKGRHDTKPFHRLAADRSLARCELDVYLVGLVFLYFNHLRNPVPSRRAGGT